MTVQRDRHTAQLNLAKELLHSYGELRLAVSGSSMIPCVFPGDVLTIRKHAPNEIASGDVVLFWHRERFFVHRVVRKVSGLESVHWITRGDALAEDDPPVRDGEMLGRVTLIERDAEKWEPVRPKSLARFLRWGVRRSSALLRLVLSWHAHRRGSQRGRPFPPATLHLKGCS